MTAVKERIIGAVSIMSDRDADIFWHIIQKHFTAPDLFAQADIDGGLVGGASLKADFGQIVNYNK